MRLGRQQVAREAPGARRVAGVERVHADRPAARVAADVAEREQARVAVERRVLDALGHDRRGQLLEAHEERARRLRKPLGQARLGEHVQVLARGQATDVRAVDRQRGERLLQALDARPQPPQPVDVGRERTARLLELGLGRPLAERARVAAQLGPQRGQRRLAGRVDEQRADVVEELVADRALDRPVAQLLAGIEDLLHPDVLHAAVAQPLEVAGRVGEPVGMVDAQPVDEPLGDQLEREPVRLGEHVRVLLAHAGEVVDVEEAPVPAGLGVDVEELAPAALVGPVRVGVVGRHVVGHDVEHDPHARGRAPPRPARGSPPRRRAHPRAASGRSRRSRAWSPRARRTRARGTGARRRARAGTARARRRPRSRARARAGAGRSRGTPPRQSTRRSSVSERAATFSSPARVDGQRAGGRGRVERVEHQRPLLAEAPARHVERRSPRPRR